MFFGRGNSTGVLDVPVGGTLKLGSSSDRIENLLIAYNDVGGGNGAANLDFTITNPIFEAYVATDLSVGRVAGTGPYGTADGTLVLGSNSRLDLGTTEQLATLNIGWNQSNSTTWNGLNGSNATGVFDALASIANVTLHLSDLNVGRGWGQGTPSGTLRWNQTEVIKVVPRAFNATNNALQ